MDNGIMEVVGQKCQEFQAEYPKARRSGPFLFIAGTSARLSEQVLCGEQGAKFDIRSQTEACIEDIKLELVGLGGNLENLIEITSYLINMSDYGGYNDVYGKYFPPNGPARTTVAVHQLPYANQLIELRAIAYIAQDEVQN